MIQVYVNQIDKGNSIKAAQVTQSKWHR